MEKKRKSEVSTLLVDGMHRNCHRYLQFIYGIRMMKLLFLNLRPSRIHICFHVPNIESYVVAYCKSTWYFTMDCSSSSII